METQATCRLCLLKPAEGQRSHIVPKFLTKNALFPKEEGHAILMKLGKKPLKIQDSIKIAFFLCSSCEQKIGIVEHFSAQHIHAINNWQATSTSFLYKQDGWNKSISCIDFPLHQALIFFYSII